MKLWVKSVSRRRLLAGAGGLLAIAALSLPAIANGGAGAATATPTGGPIALLATVGGGPTGKIVVAGAIGDWGTTLTIDKNGRPDQNGNYVKVTLHKGSFEIDSTALNEKTANPHPQVASDRTCSVGAGGSAPVTFFNGTGLYKGISGTANVTLTFTGVGRRVESGPKQGKCSHSGDAIAMLGSVIGRGTVRFA